MIQKAAAMATGGWQLHHDNMPTHPSHLMQSFWQNIKLPKWLSSPYSPGLLPCKVWLFPKLKSHLKGKRFQTIDEYQENMTGQLRHLGELCEVPRWLIRRGLRWHCPTYNVSCVLYLYKCLWFSYYVAGYLVDWPCICERSDSSVLLLTK